MIECETEAEAGQAAAGAGARCMNVPLESAGGALLVSISIRHTCEDLNISSTKGPFH